MNSYEDLIKFLITHKLTIATAESCTGGLISKRITDIPGSSQAFIGGVVSYSNEMKKRWLGVSQTTLVNYGAVSGETVEEMVNGIKNETRADIGVAVSGIAGPSGGTKEKPVGTVFIGVAYKNHREIRKFKFDGARDEIRNKCADEVLTIIQQILREHFSNLSA